MLIPYPTADDRPSTANTGRCRAQLPSTMAESWTSPVLVGSPPNNLNNKGFGGATERLGTTCATCRSYSVYTSEANLFQLDFKEQQETPPVEVSLFRHAPKRSETRSGRTPARAALFDAGVAHSSATCSVLPRAKVGHPS